MATCAQYAAIPCNAMSKAEYAEYIEAGGEPNPLPKPSGGKMGDRSSTASTNTAGVGRDDAAHNRRIRPNLASATAWSSEATLSPSPPSSSRSGASPSFSRGGRMGVSPREAAMRCDRASAPASAPNASASTTANGATNDSVGRAERRAMTKASIKSSLAKIDALLEDGDADDDGFGFGVGDQDGDRRRVEDAEPDLPVARGTFPAMKKQTRTSPRSAAKGLAEATVDGLARAMARGGGSFDGYGGKQPSPPARGRRRNTEAKMRQWREASGDELMGLLLRGSSDGE